MFTLFSEQACGHMVRAGDLLPAGTMLVTPAAKVFGQQSK